MVSRLQCAVALCIMATSFIAPAVAARVLHEEPSEDLFSPDTGVRPDAVDLGTATGYSVFAHSTVTNTGYTTLGGHLGVFPGTAVAGESYLIYSAEPTENGRVIEDLDLQIAKDNVTSAYNNAAGRTDGVVLIEVVNIGGLTFGPGLYKTTDSLEVSTGTLYLKGGPDDVFIFQISKYLKMSTNREMILQGGAQAKNVFWQVGISAIFDVGSSAFGTVMAHDSITSQTGCSFTGRLIALNEAVTFDASTVVFPQ